MADIKSYQNNVYRNYLFATEGLRAMALPGAYWRPSRAGDDIHLIGGEPHAASTAGTFPDDSREDIIAAETGAWAFTPAATSSFSRAR